MQEVKTTQINEFDYSVLNKEEKLATLENEKKLDEVFERYQPEVGEILYKQQKILASHDKGTFQKWYESKGFNRGKVYQYINKYKVFNNIEDPIKKDIFINAPTSLQNEMSKPSAKKEVNQAVFDGDIKTHKEYKEMEKRIKEVEQAKQQAERQAEQAKKSEEIALRKLEAEQSKEPEVIEKEVIKKVDNTDYERIKKLEKQIESMKLSNEDFSQKEKEVKLLQLDASKSVLNTKIKIDEFLQEVSVTSYRRGAIATSSDGTKSKLREGIDDLKNFIREMELALDGTIEH